MNKTLLSLVSCLALTVGFTFAGETTTKKLPTISDDAKSCCASGKNMEFRVGPSFGWVDASIEASRRAQGFNFSDIGLDDVNYGLKANFDWEFAPRLHWNTGFSWTHVDQKGSLDKDITWGSGNTLLRGSRVKAQFEYYELDTKIGYDVVKTSNFRLMPYIGVKGDLADGKASALSGSQRREDGKITTIDKTKNFDRTEAYGNYLVGFETQYRIIKPLFVGFDFGGYHMGDFFGGVGKGYVGYDINETWTVRLGVDSEYVNVDYSRVKADAFNTSGYAQLGVKF